MWKPGQIVTINGKRYRITRSRSSLGIIACEYVCSFYNKDTPFSCFKQKLCFHPESKLPDDCYLKHIKANK